MAVGGKDLYEYLVELSGLEPDKIKPILDGLLEKKGLQVEHLNEENIREIILLYLEEVNMCLAEENPQPSDEDKEIRDIEDLATGLLSGADPVEA